MLLHKHNQETYTNMVQMFQHENRVCCVQPTGTGKSFLMLRLISDNPDKRFLIASPSTYIFSQIQTHAENYNISLENCFYMTYSKLANLEEDAFQDFECDYIILDEMHRCGASEWSKGVERLLAVKQNAKILGTSATPIRYLDASRNMAEELFDGHYAVNMSLAEAIRRNILPLPVYITAWYSFYGDIAKLEKRAESSNNPYFKRLLRSKIQKAKSMIADLNCGLETIFARHMTNPSGKYIVFCANKERLKQAYDESPNWFIKVNFNVHRYVVYSQNTASEREFTAFRDDKDKTALKLLFCVNMLNEGVHIEDIDGVIMLRATKSANIFYQQLGRALSCSAGKQPVIFDIVNNFETGDTAKQYAEMMEIGRHYGSGEEYEIQFELYDYVRDIRDILDGLRNTFQDSWEIVYEVLKDYLVQYKSYPDYDEEYHGYKLGMWCSNQRVLRNAGNLSRERIDLLNELDFIWDAKEERYMKSFYQAKTYREKYGRFPTTSDKNDESENVYRWIRNQKQIYKNGKMSDERVKLLESIGLELEIIPKDVAWDKMYEGLADYVRERGNFPATNDSKESDEIYSIYRWMLRQRKLYRAGKLTDEQIKNLESIGFVWDAAEDLWKKQFILLQSYVNVNHKPPTAKTKVQGIGIGQWYLKQKKLYGENKLTEDQAKKLESLCILDIDSYDEYNKKTWNKNYELLKSFIADFQRLPFYDERYHGICLYEWLFAMKRRYHEGKLESEYVEKFKELGIDIANYTSNKDMPRSAWMQTFEEYRLFLDKYHRQPRSNDGKLYAWQTEMLRRYKRGNLKPSQITLLRDVGVIE